MFELFQAFNEKANLYKFISNTLFFFLDLTKENESLSLLDTNDSKVLLCIDI